MVDSKEKIEKAKIEIKQRKSGSFRITNEDMRAIIDLMDHLQTADTTEVIRFSLQLAANGSAAISSVARDTIIPSRGYDYSQVMAEAESLALVFNDMYNWLMNHQHRDVLKRRMADNQRPTRIYLLHPNSPVIDYVAAKSNKLHQLAKTGENRQLYDIKRSLFFLLDGLLDKIGDKTRIIGHQWVHAYSMVMDEKAAYVTPYLNKRVGNDGIIHVYRAGPNSPTEYMYRDLRDDLEDMERYTVDLPSLNLVKYAREHPEDMRKELYVD